MGFSTCLTCERILDEAEFIVKDVQTGRRDRTCKYCSAKKRRDVRASQKESSGNWLFAGCIHLPFEHPDFIPWMKYNIQKYKFSKKFILGDLYDWGGLNRFEKNPLMPSPLEEWSRTLPIREKLYELIPEAEMINGNHDNRPVLRAAEAYMPDIINVGLNKVMGIPEGWTHHGSMMVANHDAWGEVVIMHGDKINKDALVNAKSVGRHFVMADRHTMCKTAFVETIMGEKRFGINTGCIIDADREAFAYSRGRILRPIIAVGAIIDGNPQNLIMRTDKHNRWIDR